MTLPFGPPLTPMLARAAVDIPEGDGWRYEPKWDGFRALAFRDGPRLEVISRNGQPLLRYFPELEPALRSALPGRTVVDGEIIIAGPRGLDFDALQMRLHPAASRVARLAAQTPASIVLFDLLARDDVDLRPQGLDSRRAALRDALGPGDGRVAITPQTASLAEARVWFTAYEGAGLDGLIAKGVAEPYRPGERRWVKVKHLRTVDVVIGGFRPASGAQDSVGSLLLGLYDEAGVLHHVGHTSSFSAAQRREVFARLQPLIGAQSFGDGRTPGAPSRWSQGRDASWTSVEPRLVCEVSFDHLQGQRFRHAARFLRWRPDREPSECTAAQLAPPEAFALADIVEFPQPPD